MISSHTKSSHFQPLENYVFHEFCILHNMFNCTLICCRSTLIFWTQTSILKIIDYSTIQTTSVCGIVTFWFCFFPQALEFVLENTAVLAKRTWTYWRFSATKSFSKHKLDHQKGKAKVSVRCRYYCCHILYMIFKLFKL